MRQLRPECGDELVRLHVAHAEVRDDADAARPLDAVAGAHRDAVPLGEAAREGRVRVPGQVYVEQVGLCGSTTPATPGRSAISRARRFASL